MNEPKCFPGDRVIYVDHHGKERSGTVTMTETWYGGNDNRTPFHDYTIHGDGLRRHHHVGDGSIYEVLAENGGKG